jgi:hypothetical protein
MNGHASVAVTRSEQLRARCELQRQQLARQFAAVEIRLQTADKIVSVFGSAIKRPQWWLTGLAGLWVIKRTSVWSLIGRGWMLWTSVRSMMKWFKR